MPILHMPTLHMKVPPAMRFIARHALLTVFYAAIGLLFGLASFLVLYVDRLPGLDVWHTTELSAEYSQHTHPDISTFAQYQQLEQQLFAEQEQDLYALAATAADNTFSRYHKGGLLDPTHYARNWNRSQLLQVDHPKAGFLLLHGLSDSPYSLRALAETLQQHRADVIALRLPGHGTIPSGLLHVRAEDFKASVRMAARALRTRIGEQAPLYLVGYSNGATLAVDYALARLEGEDIPAIDGMVLISPAIGVSEFAAFAAWQKQLAHVPGLQKLAWHSIQPEYDPYKYNSFPLNAAQQIYRLTTDIHRRLDAQAASGTLGRFPPVLCFVSAVDATVAVSAVVDNFLARLTPNGHRLVVYDINREEYSAFLFSRSTRAFTEQLLEKPLPVAVTLLTNTSADSKALMMLQKAALATTTQQLETHLRWPEGIYSLSHVALPIAPDDPVYGNGKFTGVNQKSLGNITLRGERNVLRVPESQLMRLRYNPFYHLQEDLILGFTDLGRAAGGAPPPGL